MYSIDQYPINYISNYSLHIGIFPDRLIMTVVKPLYKREDNFDISYYRPSSLLPTFAKIF